ncbi:type I-E CRISPR-associated protein Cse1/CasA [Nocardiopsis mangrovi]|uniref:Type I-E CRISPR-associated protein Cse1/CasA n=1 Tax=Nocardiopsis mangrovi TaxID=1179818 RepID=A0ABV9DV22_9ACTN
MTDRFSFNLADEAWLPFIGTDGKPGTASLRDALTQAHLIRDLVVDAPTQYPALIRLLLAVLHRSLGRSKGTQVGTYPPNQKGWALWLKAALPPADLIDDYLGHWRGRFDLFDAHEPFFQAAGLTTGKGTPQGRTVGLLVPFVSSGNNAPIFSSARDDAPAPLTPGQAARWLVHAHAWDTAGIKTGARGDPEATGGKVYRNPTGPLGALGVVVLTGATLWETLALNLVYQEGWPDADLPVWEREPLTAAWEERPATGLLDLYTWPGRRIRLLPDALDGATRVRRVLVCAGDRLRHERLHTLEPHTAWRANAAPAKTARKKEKKKEQKPADGRRTDDPDGGDATDLYRPIRHLPGEQLWRGLGGILGVAEGKASGQRGMLPPRQVARLNAVRGLPPDKIIRVHASGIAYGNQNAVIDETYDDVLPLPVAVLRSEGHPVLAETALDAVDRTKNAAWTLGRLASDVAFVSGADEPTQKSRGTKAHERLYAALDQPFRAWVQTLTDDDLADELAADWQRRAANTVQRIADELLHHAPPGAHRTRWRPGKKPSTKDPVNAALAEREFRRRLRRHLPLAFPPETAPPPHGNGDSA